MSADHTQDRFWAKVDKDGPNGCWLWTANQRKGYGQFSANGRLHTAHRYAYELLVGPIPAGLTIDHLCRERLCVNPDHLEPVTLRENIQRGGNKAKTHCRRGHPYDEKNTYVTPEGRRRCRACERDRFKRLDAKRPRRRRRKEEPA